MKKLVVSVTKKDLEVQTFCSGGPGGQHQNKTQSGVRIIHRESGAVGESRDDRSQHSNKKTALKRMTEHPKFKTWVARKLQEDRTGETIEETIDKMLAPENIRIDVKDDSDKWVELKES